MLQPIIMIGCGGSGQKSVRYVRDAVRRRLIHAGWGDEIPQAWQFLAIDTVNTQEDPRIPFLPNNDYVSVALNFTTFQQLNSAIEAKFGVDVNPEAFSDLQGWRPNPTQVHVPLKKGAAQLRAVGRLAGILSLQDLVKNRISYAFQQCAAGGPQLVEVSKHLGVEVPPGTPTPDPIVMVIGSMAGGTGAGIMLDVVDLIRRTNSGGAFPILVAYTPDIFGTAITNDSMTANSAAFMSELLSAYWDNEASDSVLIPAQVNIDTRGPHSTFLVGRTNIDGLDLQDSMNVYRAVGEALAAVTTSAGVQTKFDNFIKTNWEEAKSSNAGGYGFEAAELPGVVSSFGSATVSIGRDRFRDYLQKLLHRSIVEHLTSGYESVASSTLGDNVAQTMVGSAKIAELARRNIDNYLLKCGLLESTEGTQQISSQFVSNEILNRKAADISQQIRQAFTASQQMSGAAWQQTILSQAKQVEVTLFQTAEFETASQLRKWGTEVLQQVLRTSTDFSAEFSIPVVLQLIDSSKAKILEVSQLLREDAKESRDLAQEKGEKAKGHLSPKASGNLTFSSSPVGDTVKDISQKIVLEWAAKVRDQLANALESVNITILSSVFAALNQSHQRMVAMCNSQDGKPALVSEWPKADGVVPTQFQPSPVEFFLESYDQWPKLRDSLIERSLGNREGLPISSVAAARTLIIKGGFGATAEKTPLTPLLWVDGGKSSPEWETGHLVSAKVQDDFQSLSDRIEQWLVRPGTDLQYVLGEGLSDYLSDVDSRTMAPIADHQQRLTRFYKNLQLALMQSRPLVEIDTTMNATVHPKGLAFDLNIQGFPFGVGHPARTETEQIIQGFLNTALPVDWAFTSSEAESVLITSFLKSPVHPSVVNSFTTPINSALQSFIPNPDLLRSSFWQWKRARVLENFIPLPDALRIAAIRGFAIGRAVGLMTALTNDQNQISTTKGVAKFPKNLLTSHDANNLLPALLEAMILAFGDAPTSGRSAFDAYGALIELGTGGGSVHGFSVDGLFEKILRDGDYGSVKILDNARSAAIVGSTLKERSDKVIDYLTANLDRFERIKNQSLDPKSWRNTVGTVDPVDVLTRELINDLLEAYTQVKSAVQDAQMGGTVV
jgi:hypothetical protein